MIDNDSDNDGVCNNAEIPGCQDQQACNYNISATDAGNCIYSDENNCVRCVGNQNNGTGTTDIFNNPTMINFCWNLIQYQIQ